MPDLPAGWREDSERDCLSYWEGDRRRVALTAADDETGGTLELDGVVINLNAITNVCYGVKSNDSGYKGRVWAHRRFDVKFADSETGIGFVDSQMPLVSRMTKRDRHDSHYSGLAGISQAVIEPRLSKRIVSHLDAGESVVIGGIELSASGLTIPPSFGRKDRRHYDWKQFAAVKTEGARAKEEVVVYVRDPDSRQGLMRRGIPSRVWDARLLPHLLPVCAQRFGSGENAATTAEDRAENP